MVRIPLRAGATNSADNNAAPSSVGFGPRPFQKKQQRQRQAAAVNARSPAKNLILARNKSSEAPPLPPSDDLSLESSTSVVVDGKALCHRVSSKSAARLIQTEYERGQPGLLVITTDASGGSGRFHGLCAILRQINNGLDQTTDSVNNGLGQTTDSVSIATRRTRAVQQCTGKRKSRTRRASRARRIGSGRVLGVPAEISAVSLGLRAALNEISPDDRSNILLLVDCERAISYLCDGLYEDGDMIFRTLQSLANHTKSGVLSVASVASVSKLRFDGFFDHAAADYMAGIARGRSNQDSDSLIDGEYHRLQCPKLQEDDLNWLGASEDKIGTLNISSGSLARDREEGRARIDRLAKRISSQFDIDPLDNANQ